METQPPQSNDQSPFLVEKSKEEAECTEQEVFVVRNSSKKSSKLIKADSMRTITSEKRNQPLISLPLEDQVEETKQFPTQSSFMKKSQQQKPKRSHQNSLLKSLHMQELYEGKAFPSLLEK